MVTYAQAQERAEEWINGDVPAYQHREVRVREFELGFVVWGEDRAEGPRSDAGGQRLVIARDSGEATLWPALPVGEVIRRYEEEYGRADGPREAVPAPAAARLDLNQTSFLLTPPEWLQEAADKLGLGERRAEGADVPGPAAQASADGGSAPVAGAAAGGGTAGGTASGAAASSGGSGPAGTRAGVPTGADVPVGATPWAGTDTNAGPGEDDRSVPLPATVFAPPLGDADEAPRPPAVAPDAPTALMSGGSQLPPTAVAPALDLPGVQGGAPGAAVPPGAPGVGQGSVPPPPPGTPAYGHPHVPPAQGTPPADVPPYPPAQSTPPAPPAGPAGAPAYGYPQGSGAPGYGYPPAPGGAPQVPQSPAAPGGPERRLAPNAGEIADAATSKAAPPKKGRGGAGAPPPPPGAPGTPGARPGSAAAPPPPVGGYVPTRLVPAVGTEGPEAQDGPGNAGGTQPPGGAHHAATVLAGPSRPNGPAPQSPGAPGAPGASGMPDPAGGPAAPGGPSAPQPPGAPGGQGVPGGPTASGAPAAPGAPGMPGAPGGAPNVPGTPGAPGAPGAPQPPAAPGRPAAPGFPQPPNAPGTPGTPSAHGAVHHAETVLAAPPVAGPGVPPPPVPGAPGMPGAPGLPMPPGVPGVPPAPGASAMPPGAQPPPPPGAPGTPGMPPAAPVAQPPVPPGAMPPPGGPMPGQAAAYGYPQQGRPTVGPGYQAVLRYRAQDGSEQQLIRRSAPGTPHPEWQIFHELRAMNVPPDQVLELHTELESCELPGAYCARMIREQWPQARIASIAPYGTDQASRQQGMRQLLAHQGELHQVADGPARPAPVRAPLPPVQAAPPVPPEGIAQELAGAFGPGVFRFEQQAVSRQGVPPIVAHTLVVAGLPLDMGPFFWAQAQPGRPVPTLAELAAERGVRPAADAGSYLVMGTDFGKAVCVQYGTANIVAVPVEAGPGGAPVPPQFVNTGLPEFTRCLALLGRMWRLRYGLNQEQAGRWTVDFQAQLAALDPAALGSPESWWSVLLEQMWDGLL
ncbi:SUKH-4 family immunity protein [Streptomyces sp. NPDC047841]|uniref:SUKH-4 family immunity protein n=1 Tax=Streptomyces sp. NPDC047841 TaxID=3154708 RepID=UPI003456D201